MQMKTILLLGATGIFGRRLAQRLVRVEGLHLVLAARGKARLDELEQELLAGPRSAQISSLACDHRQGLLPILAQARPWLVIDTSGPFQSIDYRIPQAALAAGSHFIDLADARSYLKGFAPALDDDARARRLVALAGVSSTPALSAAAVASITENWQRIDTVDISITPDGRNFAGRAATEGVLSYAGMPVRIFRFGSMLFVPGWTNSRVIRIPGLGRRRVAPVETIDAELLTARHRITSRVSFRAGLESWLEQWVLIAMARLRQWRMLRTLSPLVPALTAARRLTSLFCGNRGGMQVSVTGLDSDAHWTESTWSLLAKRGHGPYVPALPAVAAVQMLLEGKFEKGARTAAGEIPLAAIEAEFAALAITTQRCTKRPIRSSFENALGSTAYGRLPESLRRLHDLTGPPIWHGVASVEGGKSVAARFITYLFQLPDTATEIPVTVSIERGSDGSEIWTRDFNGRRFYSVIRMGNSGNISESFGPMTFIMPVAANLQGLSLPVRRWRFLNFTMPGFLLPKSEAYEYVDEEERFRFDVRLELPFFGLLVHYKGWLKPAVEAPSGESVNHAPGYLLSASI